MMRQEKDENSVSVISPKFCVGHSVDLVITKNIWLLGQGNFTVKNANGKLMFTIKGSIFCFEPKRVMFDAAGVPVVTLRKKVFGGDGKDLIFSARRSSIFQMKTKLVVFMAKDVRNYTVQGSWFERSCQVYVGDSSTLVAQMHKSFSINSLLTGNDRFMVTVYPNVDCAFIAALIIILDDIVSPTKRSSSKIQKHKSK